MSWKSVFGLRIPRNCGPQVLEANGETAAEIDDAVADDCAIGLTPGFAEADEFHVCLLSLFPWSANRSERGLCVIITTVEMMEETQQDLCDRNPGRVALSG